MTQPNAAHPFTQLSHTEPYLAISPTKPSLSAKGKTILITGGSEGIGYAIVAAFAAAGAANIIILARRAELLDEAKKNIAQQHPVTNIHAFYFYEYSHTRILLCNLIGCTVKPCCIYVHRPCIRVLFPIPHATLLQVVSSRLRCDLTRRLIETKAGVSWQWRPRLIPQTSPLTCSCHPPRNSTLTLNPRFSLGGNLRSGKRESSFEGVDYPGCALNFVNSHLLVEKFKGRQ